MSKYYRRSNINVDVFKRVGRQEFLKALPEDKRSLSIDVSIHNGILQKSYIDSGFKTRFPGSGMFSTTIGYVTVKNGNKRYFIRG
jgi:hypothetical protein